MTARTTEPAFDWPSTVITVAIMACGVALFTVTTMGKVGWTYSVIAFCVLVNIARTREQQSS